MAIEKLKRHISPCTEQIPAEFMKAGCRTFRSEFHKLVNSVWNKELPEERKGSIIVPNYKKADTTDFSNY
jgi:hypothetical protein